MFGFAPGGDAGEWKCSGRSIPGFNSRRARGDGRTRARPHRAIRRTRDGGGRECATRHCLEQFAAAFDAERDGSSALRPSKSRSGATANSLGADRRSTCARCWRTAGLGNRRSRSRCSTMCSTYATHASWAKNTCATCLDSKLRHECEGAPTSAVTKRASIRARIRRRLPACRRRVPRERRVQPRHPPSRTGVANRYNRRRNGEMAERIKAPVLKTSEGSNLPWVRIPLSAIRLRRRAMTPSTCCIRATAARAIRLELRPRATRPRRDRAFVEASRRFAVSRSSAR